MNIYIYIWIKSHFFWVSTITNSGIISISIKNVVNVDLKPQKWWFETTINQYHSGFDWRDHWFVKRETFLNHKWSFWVNLGESIGQLTKRAMIPSLYLSKKTWKEKTTFQKSQTFIMFVPNWWVYLSIDLSICWCINLYCYIIYIPKTPQFQPFSCHRLVCPSALSVCNAASAAAFPAASMAVKASFTSAASE